jgi:alpha-1,6-mannosyltransferase
MFTLNKFRLSSKGYNLCLALIPLCALSSYYLAAIHFSQAFHKTHFGAMVATQFTVMALVMLAVWRFGPEKNSRYFVRNLIFVGLIARLILVGVEPYTSNDVDRYLFDGRIALTGLDPYRHSHDDASLTELRALWQPPQEHARYPTLYPPLAIGLFALSASAGVEYAHTLWRMLTMAASILVMLLGAVMLKKANKLQHFSLIALSPLLILESGVGLHLDIFSTLAVVAALVAWQYQRLYLCGLLIGLGAMVKVLPIMLLLPLFFIQPNLRRALTLLCGALTFLAFGYGLAFFLGFKPLGSLEVFFEKWRFASPIFTFLDGKLTATKIFIICVSLATIASSLIAIISYRNKNASKSRLIIVCLQLSLALPLILSPVVFPWYLLPLVPLLALEPSIYLLVWTLLMPLTYEVLSGFSCCQLWEPALWPVILITVLYVLTFFVLAKNVFTLMVAPQEQT